MNQNGFVITKFWEFLLAKWIFLAVSTEANVFVAAVLDLLEEFDTSLLQFLLPFHIFFAFVLGRIRNYRIWLIVLILTVSLLFYFDRGIACWIWPHRDVILNVFLRHLSIILYQWTSFIFHLGIFRRWNNLVWLLYERWGFIIILHLAILMLLRVLLRLTLILIVHVY